MVQHCPAHGVQHVLDSADHMGTVVQHDHTPHEHAGMLSLGGGTEVFGVPQ
jgi:hypothetical protein